MSGIGIVHFACANENWKLINEMINAIYENFIELNVAAVLKILLPCRIRYPTISHLPISNIINTSARIII